MRLARCQHTCQQASRAKPPQAAWLGLSEGTFWGSLACKRLSFSTFGLAWIGRLGCLVYNRLPPYTIYITFSSHSNRRYNSSISVSDPARNELSLGPKPAFCHLRTHCIAAKSSADIPRRRGCSRSPSSLNMRSQSQLEAGIEITSSASLDS